MCSGFSPGLASRWSSSPNIDSFSGNLFSGLSEERRFSDRGRQAPCMEMWCFLSALVEERCLCPPSCVMYGEQAFPKPSPGSLPWCNLGRMFLEVAIGKHTQIQDGLVSIAKALRAATPFVVPNALKDGQKCGVGHVIAPQDALRGLAPRAPRGEPANEWIPQPLGKSDVILALAH